MGKLKYEIDTAYQPYAPWILDVPRHFDGLGTVVRAKRNVIRKVEGPDGSIWVIKRYKRPNIVQQIGYSFFRKSKTARAFAYARFLTQRGIATPQPIACIEEYDGLLLGASYFFSTFQQGETCTTLQDHPDAGLTRSLALFICSMHDAGFMHGDTNLSNFSYTSSADGHYAISTCDLNRSVIIAHASRKACLRNLTRLTHDLSTSAAIVAEYAALRGWTPEECIDFVHSQIRRLERWEDIRGILTRKKPEYRKRTSI